MAQPLFFVAVRDLERTDLTRSWPMPPEWLAQVFEGSEATPDGAPGQLDVYLKLSAREVLVKGTARARVVMPCARTLDPVTVDLDAAIFLLLTPKVPAAAPKRVRVRSGTAEGSEAPERPVRPERKRSATATAQAGERPARTERKRGAVAEALDAELSDEEAARDHYDGESVILDEFIREHLLLELPLFPVRSDLPSEEPRVTGSLPDPAGTDEPVALDPRLAPLAALRFELKGPGVAKK